MSAQSIEKRIIRIESRLVQIMCHLGLDPYAKTYEDTNHPNLADPTVGSPRTADPQEQAAAGAIRYRRGRLVDIDP